MCAGFQIDLDLGMASIRQFPLGISLDMPLPVLVPIINNPNRDGFAFGVNSGAFAD
jgi:hypothetical protein